jgi:hypothetical protein
MPQTGPDLVSAGYATSNPVTAFLNGTTQVAQPNLAARSNLYLTGLNGLVDSATGLTSGLGIAVPIPVVAGDTITKVSVLVGAATASSTPTHQWAALYSGITIPALMGQSTDTTTAAITASTLLSYTLATPQVITATNAPFGWVYAAFCTTATAVESVLRATVVANYAWYTNGPQSAASFTGAAATAPATMAAITNIANPPIVILT